MDREREQKQLSEDEAEVREWVDALHDHVNEAVQDLCNLTAARLVADPDLAKFFYDELECSLVSTTARCALVGRTSPGNLIGHFADHVVDVVKSSDPHASMGRALNRLIRGAERELLHHAAKTNSSGN